MSQRKNAPPQNHENYFNRRQHYSVNPQAIVDAKLRFIHATVGYPGSIHDARLRLSGLYDFAENEQIQWSNAKYQWNRNRASFSLRQYLSAHKTGS